jgi:hypothetical protein
MNPTLVLIGALLVFGAAGSATTWQATPTPNVPAPELCRARPRTFDEMRPGPPPDEPTETATGTPGPTPSPVPASPEIVGGITTKVREFVACLNTGEVLRVYGLYSDWYLYDVVMDPRQELLTRDAYEDLATPKPPPPNERAKILDIPEVVVLSDGRVRALVKLEFRFDRRPRTLALTFVDADGRWMIDFVGGPVIPILPLRT